MDVSVWLIIINACLFAVIWLTQIIVYPGMLFYSEREMTVWHPRYTHRISYIIAPLMLGQLSLYLTVLWTNLSIFSMLGLLFVLVSWYVTFIIAVPLHNNIESQSETKEIRLRLIKINWYRTAAWTGSFILSLFDYGL